MGTAGVDDDGGLRVAANLQQIKHLASCLFESVGCDVGGEHFRGQFENHHQRIGGLLTGLLDTLPSRTQQGEHGQQPRETEGDPGQFTVTSTATAEQCRVKGCRQDHLPAPGALLAVPELPEQPAKHRQQQQPPGAEPVRPQRTHRRLRRRRRLRRWRQSGSNCVCKNRSLVNRRCKGLSGQSTGASSSMLNHSARASGQ
ncbi:hypothetical protein D9M69_446740 [compost metagenome]